MPALGRPLNPAGEEIKTICPSFFFHILNNARNTINLSHNIYIKNIFYTGKII